LAAELRSDDGFVRFVHPLTCDFRR
jgi:hypothetical protein